MSQLGTKKIAYINKTRSVFTKKWKTSATNQEKGKAKGKEMGVTVVVQTRYLTDAHNSPVIIPIELAFGMNLVLLKYVH